MPNISAVVLTYNGWELTHQLLSDIRRYFPADEVLVVDNGSEDDTVYKGLKFWKKSGLLPIKVLSLEENLGFCGGANAGLKEATGDMVALLSNDVRVYNRSAFDFIAECATRDEPVLIGDTLYDYDTGWNKFGDRLFPYLGGYFLASNGWDKLGYFDTDYYPYDYEDVDLSSKAMNYQPNIPLLTVPPRCIGHTGGGTIGFNPKRLEQTMKNQQVFKDKWL